MSTILKLMNAMTRRSSMDERSGCKSSRPRNGDMWVCSILKMPKAVVEMLMSVLKREGGSNFGRRWI
jgi:hypothetical protein